MRAADVVLPDEVARLVAADPDVPGLALLLDDGALTAWLDERLPAAVRRGSARRRYLRLKPGAGGVARVDLDPGTEPVMLVVAARDAAPKLRKTVDRAGAEVLLDDPGLLTALAGPGADRDLPGLVRLRRRGVREGLTAVDPVDEDAGRLLRLCAAGGAVPTPLAWKPQRRWVAVAGPADGARVVLRAGRRAALARAAAGWAATTAALPSAAPRLLGTDTARGLMVVEHLPGTSLDRLDARDDAVLVAAGGLVGRLHAARGVGGPAPRPRPEVTGVRESATLVDLLLPVAGARRLAERVVVGLRDLPPEDVVPVHGDLSADQILLRPDGDVALLDLDQAGAGPASLDLASVAASWWATDPVAAPRRTAALLEGYDRARDRPPCRAVQVRTAAMLLRLAAEPFRHGERDWPDALARRVALSEAVLDGRAGP